MAASQPGCGQPTPHTSCTGGAPNNLSPLCFHIAHNGKVTISQDRATAHRVRYSKALAFSNRPVRVNEKVCIRIVEILQNWCSVSGARFGFTNHDPDILARYLIQFGCPDLTNNKRPGNWYKALDERFCEKNNVLYYYVNSAGDVHFGVNDEEKGLFFSGVNIRKPLWALVDLDGYVTAVQFSDTHTVEEERLARWMQSLSLTFSLSDEEPVPAPRYQNPLVPLSLHRTKGRNVQFVNDRGIAARCETEICQGYVFTALPMRPGQTIVVQILTTKGAYSGSLAIGLTSCDPATLSPCELPDYAELLIDRSEYWVVRRDAANGLRRGDELAVSLSMDGVLRVSPNDSNPISIMHVDHTLRLWAFVDIYGATQKVRMLSSPLMQTPGPRLRDQMRVITSSATPIATASGGTVLDVVSLPPQNNQNAVNHQQMTLASAHYIEPIQSSQLCLSSLPLTQPSCSLPQPGQNSINEQVQIPNDLRPSTSRQTQPIDSVIGENPQPGQNSINEQVQIPNDLRPSTSRQTQPIDSVIGENFTGTECTICYDNPIDSVLYMCGHMCMCYLCALQQWHGTSSGKCPLCRAQIKDVIRTYKS